ncbi:unnamed protein product [Lactuca saligna]|uniref:Uncharacterized protein n=1 Tax=Lactuca saligna TaxID=75948 RepID=A0AA36A3U8_LACSI|nr:unnamed protein product [Lactuca saligna]
MPSQRGTWDPNHIFTSVKDETKPPGMKELSSKNNKYRGGVLLHLTHKFSYRREPTRASDERNDTPNDSVKNKIAGVHKSAGGILTRPRIGASHGRSLRWVQKKGKCKWL